MSFTQQDFNNLGAKEQEALREMHEAAQSSDIQVVCRLNASCPTELARRIFRNKRLQVRDAEVVAVRSLIHDRWIVGVGPDNSHETIRGARYRMTSAARTILQRSLQHA